MVWILSAVHRINKFGNNHTKLTFLKRGRGGGQVVSVLAFYSDDPSLNPAEAYSFICNIVFENNKNKQKRGRVWHT